MADIFDQISAQGSKPDASPSNSGDVFDQVSQQSARQAQPPQRTGFLQGVYDTTVAPIAQLATDTAGHVANQFTPEGQANNQQMAQQQEAYKRQAYQEAGQHLKSGQYMAAAGTLLSLLGGPQDQTDPVAKVISGLIDAHKLEARKTIAAAKAGQYSQAVGHGVATVLPGIGPAAAKAGEDIGNGNVGYGLGEGAGLIGTVLAPKTVKNVAGKVAHAVLPETAELAGGESMPVRQSKVIDAIAGPEAQETLDRSTQNPAGRRAIANVANEVADTGATAKATPPVEDPLGIRQASESLKARSKAVWNKLDELSGNKFSEAQLDAADAADDMTAAGKKAYREAIAKQDAIFDQYADQLPKGTDLQAARTQYRQYNGYQKLARSFDTAFEPTPGETDAGYINADRLRSKIADMRQQGVFKQAGFSDNHVNTIDQIATRMQDAGQRVRIGKVASGLAADAGIHLVGLGATAKIAAPLAAVRYLFGRVLLNPKAAGTLLRGLDSAYAPASIAAQVAAFSGSARAK